MRQMNWNRFAEHHKSPGLGINCILLYSVGKEWDHFRQFKQGCVFGIVEGWKSHYGELCEHWTL